MMRRALASLLPIAVLLGSLGARNDRRPAAMWHEMSSVGPWTQALSPSQVQTAYHYAPLYKQGIDGAGQSIALIEVDSFDRADVQEFDRQYNLPDPSISEQSIGGSGFVRDHSGETTMDVEWVHALAPRASIQIYYLNNYVREREGWQALALALRTAMSHGAGTVSMSMNACRPGSGFSVTAAALGRLVRAGVSVFVSSGDSGAHPGPAANCGRRVGVAYPASDPSVISVGGTSLSLTSDNSIAGEVAWAGSGGGRVKHMLRSIWQTDRHIPADRYRWAPDVAFVGDPQTGVSMYYRGFWSQAGGTSIGAPAWAAAWALVMESMARAGKPVGPAPALLYRLGNSLAYGRDFHDITRGGNWHYHAGVGWDAVTGLGTPDVATLAADVLALGRPR